MTTSICMGLYNGEKYIETQLASLLHQTRTPEEVVLCDDGSTDDTVVIARNFIERNQLQGKWHLYCNEQNKGYPGNFYHVMSLCTQEIVFLADQDDIWDVTKMERMCAVLEQHPKAKAVACKYGLIDEAGETIQTIMNPTHNRGTGELRTITIEDVFYKFEWPGMVIAYRKEWYQKWWEQVTHEQKNDFPMVPHDFLVCAWAAEEGGFLQMDEELAWHRRHDSNTGGEEHHIRKLLNKNRKLKEIADYLKILDAFEKESILRTAEGKEALQRKLQSMKGRQEALLSGKISQVIANAWKQRRSVRLATVLCDLAIVKR